jgi:hypothetical protein
MVKIQRFLCITRLASRAQSRAPPFTQARARNTQKICDIFDMEAEENTTPQE